MGNRAAVYMVLGKQYWQKNRFLIILMLLTALFFGWRQSEIGRASCRERVSDVV